MFRQCMRLISHCLYPFLNYLNKRYKRWTKPDPATLVTGTLVDVTRSKRDLIAENAFLRQQLIVLKRQIPQPSLTLKDRGLLVLLASPVRCRHVLGGIIHNYYDKVRWGKLRLYAFWEALQGLGISIIQDIRP